MRRCKFIATLGATAARPLTGCAAAKLGGEVESLTAANERAHDDVFAAVRRQAPLVIANETFFANRGEPLAARTPRNRVPTAHPSRECAATGGLLGYGGRVAQSHRQDGIYTGRILRDARPGDLPVRPVTKVEAIGDVATAKARALEAPVSRLSVADEVFE